MADIRSKSTLDAGGFLLGVAVLFLLFSYALSLVPLEWFGLFYAHASLAALKAFGFAGTVEPGNPVLLHIAGLGMPVGISYLCTGILEMAIVWAAVLASAGIEVRKRAIGAVAGTLVLAAFNTARIAASIMIISFSGLEAGSFGHDMLFRVFLFATVAGFYYFWFRWATAWNGKKHGKRK